jgi:hypothetical protein
VPTICHYSPISAGLHDGAARLSPRRLNGFAQQLRTVRSKKCESEPIAVPQRQNEGKFMSENTH